MSAQAQQLWAKESEFRAFLQSTGRSISGLNMDGIGGKNILKHGSNVIKHGLNMVQWMKDDERLKGG